jgi:hypothetical protein
VWLEETYELFGVTTDSIFRDIFLHGLPCRLHSITTQNALLFIGMPVRTSNLTSKISHPSAMFIDHMEEVVQEMEGRGRIYATTLSVPLNGYYRRNEICLSPPASS